MLFEECQDDFITLGNVKAKRHFSWHRIVLP
jgi:hypothetical protein